jgi:transcriptional regulator with XRE-family HTH domain
VATTRTLHHQQTPEFRAAAELLGRKVRRLRGERGWTVEEAAKHFQVQPHYVFVMERGTANPSLAILISVAKALEVTVPELLTPE